MLAAVGTATGAIGQKFPYPELAAMQKRLMTVQEMQVIRGRRGSAC